MRKGLDIEAQCWADSSYVLSIELLENGGFACIVETSDRSQEERRRLALDTYKKRIRISFSF